MQEHELQSADLTVLIHPEQGGRVASIRNRHTGVEFLTQARKAPMPVRVGLDARFQDGPCAGIEECLPTVGACGMETVGGAVPDHGDFWQMPWDVMHATDTGLRITASGFSRPIRFRKEFSLTGNTLSIWYSMTNVGAEESSVLYACHPLFAVDAGDRICLDEEVSRLMLYYSRGNRMGAKGDMVSWPGSTPDAALDTAMPSDSGFAEMLYTGRLKGGRCGIYRSAMRQGLRVRFDPEVLPYLGVWLCHGGWPEDTGGPRQHAVALEPTFAPVNTLKEAQEVGSAKRLRPGESMQWAIAFDVSEPDTSLDRFRSYLRSGSPPVPGAASSGSPFG